jgi:site-specific DNA recombinase
MTSKKYFSYIRVSTQRQGQSGTSLTEQQEAINRFAQSFNLSISKRFEERETAAKQGRPVFLEMLKQLKQGDADGVVIHKIDRSARNLKDWADLGSLIDNGLEVHFASESLDLNSRGGRLSADIQAVVASDFIRNLRQETIKGLYGRLKQGLFPFRAPIGYQDAGGGKPKTIDPVDGPLIRKAFELYATGDWSLLTLPDELARLGLRSRTGERITTNGISTILHNPFYMGLIRIEKTGQIFSGVHRPVVSRTLFNQVQDVFVGRNITRTKVHNFIYRRKIRCLNCSNCLVGEVQKRYVYYRCHTPNCKGSSVNESRVKEALMQKLKKLELQPNEFRFYQDEATKYFGGWKAETEKTRDEIIERQKRIKVRHTRLVDSYMDGLFEKEEYVERKAQLVEEENALDVQTRGLGKNWEEIPSRFDEFLELANSAYLSFESSPVDMQRELLDILTSNFTANGKSVSVKFSLGLELLAERPTFPGGRPKGVMARTISALVSQLFKLLSKVAV